jgi:hypothetical protein
LEKEGKPELKPDSTSQSAHNQEMTPFPQVPMMFRTLYMITVEGVPGIN